jgi:hypothetical protein
VITVPTAEVYAVARTYLLAVHNDCLTPTAAVQREHGLSRSRASHRLHAARALGVLPHAGRGRRAFGAGHWPRAAQWCTSGSRKKTIWTACQECHELWPCADAATLVWLQHLDEAERRSR